VQSLLFIENRELLDNRLTRNAIRLSSGTASRRPCSTRRCHVVGIGGGDRVAGGSTLATQIEKYRHSPEGRTSSLSGQAASRWPRPPLRAYQDGEDTTGPGARSCSTT
jgi:membrane peptidoglycan carboxypeptidase